jgi:tetratricopeptide (TPR) repeat protein
VENSPLELYETAYRLHYTDDRIPEALKYYDAIIREFPSSNECGYAVIQINKIKANSAAAAIAPKKGGALATISFIVCLLIIGALGTGVYIGVEHVMPEVQKAQKRENLAVRALGKIVAGKNEEALILLDELKELSGSADITPYELAAQIYRSRGLTNQARAEYETFYRKNPGMQTKPVEELVPEPETSAARKRRQ